MQNKKLILFLCLSLFLIIVPLTIQKFNSNEVDKNHVTTEIDENVSNTSGVKTNGETVSIEIIGPNGKMILPSTEIGIGDEQTAFIVLKKAAKKSKIKLSYHGKGAMLYVEGINGVNEFDKGPSSGWICYINGVPLTKSSGAVIVKVGDHITWKYVDDIGADA